MIPLPILLVEDDLNDVFFFEHAIKKAAFANPLQVVNDGQDAIAYLSGEDKFSDRKKYPRPCLVVLDLNMPRKSGFEVLKWLQLLPPLEAVPAIILSSSQAERDHQQANDLGARAYFVKPSNPGKLVDLVKLITPYCLEAKRVE